MKFNVSKVREDFPILSTQVRDQPLVYLDSAATSQKPQFVLDVMNEAYQQYHANVHRGAYWLSQVSTEKYEGVREKVAKFIGVKNTKEIIFTRGTTESINIVCSSWGQENIQEGDDIVITRMEHHSNFVPWQQLAKEKKANLKIIEINQDYKLDLESVQKAFSGNPKVFAFTMMSNVLGTLNPVMELTKMAKDKGAMVLVDAAQSVSQMPISIDELGPVDFIAFSAHKMCGPTGVGVLWGKESLLNQMKPYQFGGDMISRVQDHQTSWNELPWKFEAGTPNFVGVIGMGAAIDYLQSIGMDQIHQYEQKLIDYTVNEMLNVSGLKLIGPKSPHNRGTAFSFTLEGIHPHDLATFLDVKGISIRAGHHCAMPLMDKLQIVATTRASLLFYNTKEEVDLLIQSLNEAKKYFLGGQK